MSKTAVILCFVAILIWLYFLWSRRRFYKAYWQIGGPLGLPFVGLGFQMMKPEKFLQYMKIKGQEYKTPFMSWMGTKCFLYVCDPETIETIFNSSTCTNKGDFYSFLAAAIGDGLFTSSSPRWNKHRRLLNPAFSRHIIKTFIPIFNNEGNILISKLVKAQGQPLEIYEILKRSVLEIACHTTMGKRMGFQNDGSGVIFDAYNGITEVCVKRMLSPWLYLDYLYRFSSLFKQQQQCINILYKFIENFLGSNDSINNLGMLSSTKKTKIFCKDNIYVGDNNANDDNSKMSEKPSSHVFIEQIRQYVEKGQLTWQDVRDEANVIVAATFETTSTALYLVCLCLAMHPECQDKMYEELIDIFPDPLSTAYNNDKYNDLACTDITLDQLEQMKYTEMVINEAMRLFAPVPMVLRRASSDFSLRNGVIIPQGTQIAIDIYNMQRSTDIWGPFAQTFNPERHFSTSNKPHSFAFIPFTKGLRMCIGYRYALILMKITLAKIFRNFRLCTDAKLHNITIKGTISLKLCEYPLFTLQQRNTKDYNRKKQFTKTNENNEGK